MAARKTFRQRQRQVRGFAVPFSLLLFSCRRKAVFADARPVIKIEVHVELVSTAGSAIICDQIVADSLKQVAGTCLSACDTLVGFNSSRCNTEMGYDVVTLSGGIFGTDDDVIRSIPCIRETLAADGCGGLATEAVSSVGSLRYIGGIKTSANLTSANTTESPAAMPSSRAPTPAPIPTSGAPTARPIEPMTRIPMAAPAVVAVESMSPTTAPYADADKQLEGYLVMITLTVAAAALFSAAGLLMWARGDRKSRSAAKQQKISSLGPDCTSGESESAGSSSRSKPHGGMILELHHDIDERLFGIAVPSLCRVRDEPSSMPEKDELSSSEGSSIREDKFDNESSIFYEPSPGEDDTEVSCDDDDEDADESATEGAGTVSEYEFSLSAAESTDQGTVGPHRSEAAAADQTDSSSVGSWSNNSSFSHYVNFDERDMEDEEKRRQFLTWLNMSKIIPTAAKHSIESSLVDSYGPLGDGKRPEEVMLRDARAVESVDKVV
jgi:hypothetical protein